MNKDAILSHLNIPSYYKTLIPSLKINGKAETVGLCPFHDDHNPSLSVNLTSGLYNCFSCGAKGDVFSFYGNLKGVDFKTALQDIARQVGVTDQDSRQMNKTITLEEVKNYMKGNGYDFIRLHLYRAGKPQYIKAIYRNNTNDKKGSYFTVSDITKKLFTERRQSKAVLYKQEELEKHPKDTVFEPEGEKDCDTLTKMGLLSVTAGGTNDFKPEMAEQFRGRDVVLLPDNDDAGKKCMQNIAGHLYGIAKTIKVIELPGLPEKGDVSDWVKVEGNAKAKLLQIVSDIPEWTPAEVQGEEIKVTDSVNKWPDPPSPEAYYGLAGEFVKLIEPHTEADSVALLIQFLVMSGNIIGKSAYFIAEADIHYLNLFTVLVGLTSKGRKGSSWGRSKATFEGIDENWGKNCIKSGSSSGEGLIWAIRDPIYKNEAIKDKGKPTGEVMEVEVDHGVEDKRLLVHEAEFASTLRVMNRDGNTLSAIIRQAWDTGDLKTLTKNSPAKATGGHISIVGHITKDELRRYLDRTESGNGFANRILWVCVQRSKTLPEGGNLKESDIALFIDLLSDAIKFAREAGEIKRDDEARAIWREVYPELSEGKPGLLGAVTSRAEAQVMRLACLYAVLDFSYFVMPQHLNAAIALWEYCEASCQYIFGDSLGDPVADEILRELRKSPEGLTQTEINNMFGRNKNANQLSRALSLLMDNGLVKRGSKETTEGGRIAVLWTAM